MRPSLEATSYPGASRSRFLIEGKKYSKQTWGIFPKIREADRLVTPVLQQRVVEVHPEVSFWAMNGRQPLSHPKKSRAGAAERLGLILRFFPDAGALIEHRGHDRVDAADAFACLWTAFRLDGGDAERLLRGGPQLDARGLRMEIVF